MLTNGKRSKEAFGLSHETEPDDFDDDDDAYDDNIELAVAVKEVNKNKMKHWLWTNGQNCTKQANWQEVNIENASSSFTPELEMEWNQSSAVILNMWRFFIKENF